MQTSSVFGSREHVDSRRVFFNRSFLALKQQHFSESITSEIFGLGSWSFFSKYAKFYLLLKNAKESSENFFGFEENGV